MSSTFVIPIYFSTVAFLEHVFDLDGAKYISILLNYLAFKDSFFFFFKVTFCALGHKGIFHTFFHDPFGCHISSFKL